MKAWLKKHRKTITYVVIGIVALLLIIGTIWIVRRTGVIGKVFGESRGRIGVTEAESVISDLNSENIILKKELSELKIKMTNTPAIQVQAEPPASVIPKPAVTNNNTNAAYITTPGLPGIVNNNANTVSVNGAQVGGNGGVRLPHEEPTSVNMWPGQIYNQKINPGRNVFIEKHPGVIEISPSSQKDEWLENREFTLSYTNKTESRVVVVYMRYADKP